MAKKNTAATSPSEPRPRRQTKKPAAAPLDIATVAGTEPVESAADRTRSGDGSGNGPAPTPEEIAEAAYHRYLSRGGQDGADFDDWIEAERQLREKRSR